MDVDTRVPVFEQETRITRRLEAGETLVLQDCCPELLQKSVAQATPLAVPNISMGLPSSAKKNATVSPKEMESLLSEVASVSPLQASLKEKEDQGEKKQKEGSQDAKSTKEEAESPPQEAQSPAAKTPAANSPEDPAAALGEAVPPPPPPFVGGQESKKPWDVIPASHFLTHLDPWSSKCAFCREAKQRREYAYRQGDPHEVDEFGHLRGDWYDLGPKLKTIANSRYGLCLKDKRSRCRAFCPAPNRKTKGVVKQIRDFCGKDKLLSFTSDNAKEFIEAADTLGVTHTPAVPFRPQSNDIERDMEVISDGLKVALLVSGLDPYFSPLAGRCWTQNQNFTGKIAALDNQTPYELRNPGKPLKGSI